MKCEDKERWTREQLLRAFRQTPPEFSSGLHATLRRLEKEQEESVVKRKMGLAPVLVLILVLIAGVAVAAVLTPKTAERFGEFYGEMFQERLEQGDAAELDTSLTLGDVTYTVTDVIWAEGVLYGTVVMAPAEGANIVLIPEDFDVNDLVGGNPGYGQPAPEGAKSFRETAEALGARIVLAKCVPDGYVMDGELLTGDVGYFDTSMEDGTIVTSFEVYGWNGGIERASVYTLRLNPHNWEVTPEGEWLREEPNNTWLKLDWNVQVEPKILGTEQGTAQEALEPASTEGVEIVVPEGCGGELASYALLARDFREVLETGWLNTGAIVQENHDDTADVYVFDDDDLLVVDCEGDIWYTAYDGTEEVTYELENGDPYVSTIPHEELIQYLAGLAFWEYFDADQGACYEQPEAVADLSAITLEDAQDALKGLLGQLGIEGAQPVYVCAVDRALAKTLSDARNAEIEQGMWINSNPYDISNMTESDEGYALYYTAQVDGVAVGEEYMQIRAYVTVDGVRSLTVCAPFVLGEALDAPQQLISAEEALAAAVNAAKKSWLPDLAPTVEDAYRMELIYTVRDKTKLVPAWQVLALGGEDENVWLIAVVVSAVDGTVLNAPWM